MVEIGRSLRLFFKKIIWHKQILRFELELLIVDEKILDQVWL